MKNRVKELRENNSITQDKLGEMVGVSRITIISLEKGKYNPSIMLAYKIAKIFNLTIEEVFLFEG
ncbi:helix-turn-helix transcriptional regulator [Oceanirhabdus seepicola]|uniref:Helix-turn-helix transcriptional regulator n=1 Tax=Oceanirhabdus seepicola TaxID=2828781 RepID=A0A9J6NZH6_9CLOT|nr:helix-turn-helix transcriptional regulator [Oceanirhabdus seepicola]MCM1989850.1 helix-turn-helix transcriptional regulator [Oceanirhabdus seepicola]